MLALFAVLVGWRCRPLLSPSPQYAAPEGAGYAAVHVQRLGSACGFVV